MIFHNRGGKKRRVIDELREKFPEVTWSYREHRFPRWCCSDGWGVEVYSALYDEFSASTQYRRTDTQEVIVLSRSGERHPI